jgi:hypothetical protein
MRICQEVHLFSVLFSIFQHLHFRRRKIDFERVFILFWLVVAGFVEFPEDGELC